MQKDSRTDPVFAPTAADLQFPVVTLLTCAAVCRNSQCHLLQLAILPSWHINTQQFQLTIQPKPASPTSSIRYKQ